MSLRQFKLADVVQETPEIKTFRFEPVDRRPFNFKSGQFVLLHVGNEQRAYSISSPASESKRIDLTIRIGSETYFPKKVDKLSIGDIVGIEGPHGLFMLDPKAKNITFIGAGVGMAGLRSLLAEALHKATIKITILYSARSEKEILWRKTLDRLKNTKVVYTLTREKPAAWRGELGRIDSAMIARVITRPKNKHYYICGPTDMVESTKAALLELGIHEGRIKMESWGGIVGSV